MVDQVISGQIGIPADNWALAIGIAVISGFVGGAAEAVQQITDGREKSLHRTPLLNCLINLILEGLIGSATAMGGLFLVLLSPVTASLRGGAFWAFLCGASTLFGLFSRRLLPAIHLGFNRRLGIIEEKATEFQREIESGNAARRVEQDIQIAMEETSVPSRIERAIQSAKGYLAREPRSRSINTKLAKLLFERKKDKPASIEVLSAYIQHLQNIRRGHEGPEETTDLADALYDRACYYLNPPGPPKRDGHNHVPTPEERRLAMNDFREAFELTPEPVRLDALKDSDFDWLRENDAEFRRLLGVSDGPDNTPS